jgi:hypothetical protein
VRSDSRDECPPLPWHPYAGAGEWWLSPIWQYNCRIASPRLPLDAAESELRKVFNASWICKHRVDPARLDHPLDGFFGDSLGGQGLLELGWALHLCPGRDYIDRLRRAPEFYGAKYELWVGLWLALAGGTVRRGSESNRRSPDWIVTWPSKVELAVECKRPDQSEDRSARQHVFDSIWSNLNHPLLLSKGPRVVLLFDLTRSAPHRLARRPVDEGALRAYVQELLRWRDELLLDITPREVEHPLGRCRVLSAPHYQASVDGFEWEDDEREILRVRAKIMDGAEQIRAAGLSGLILVDLRYRWTNVSDHWQDTMQVLERPAMDHVAAVVFRTSYNRWSVTSRRLHFVPGQAVGQLPAELLGPLSKCEPNPDHLHFEPMWPADLVREPCFPF